MDNVQNRINELIAELSDCREDERNTQNQILQVITVAGTILGILFSASYLNSDKQKPFIVFQNIKADDTSYISKFCNMVNENITYSRVMFWLSLLIFFVAFAYIIVLGINNILRYYYIQNLEDRLHQLIPASNDDNDRGDFLHWNAYIAPIITQNVKHITSTHTALHFVCYVSATCFAIIFSMGMVLSLFLEIESRQWFDYGAIFVAIAVMLLNFLLFLRVSAKAKDVAQFAWNTAHENQKNRLNGYPQKLYRKSESFKYTLLYLIYPKRQDLQKPILIVLGYIYGIILMNNTINPTYIWRLIFILFIFDFLAYQARYQINDIRGLKEDSEAGCTNRLLSNNIINPGHVIKISLIVAFIKIIVCILVTIFLGGTLRKLMLISLIALFILTILYEMARTKEVTWLIFFLVGVGYPLRFFVGFFSVTSSEWAVIYNVQMVCFMLALLAYGSFSSILAWVNEVIKRMQKVKRENNEFPFSYEKQHFEYIQNIIIDRYILGENYIVNGKIMPLREKCKLTDPWNIAMISCMFCLFFTSYFGKIPKILLVMECAVLFAFIINIYLRRRKKAILMCLGLIFIIGKVIFAIIYKIPVWYFLLSVVQMIIAITYFLLSYQPQMKKVNYKALFYKLRCKIIIKILGEYAFNIMESEKNNRD